MKQFTARATENGIIFHSNFYHYIGVYTFLDEYNETQKKLVFTFLDEYSIKPNRKKIITLLLIFLITTTFFITTQNYKFIFSSMFFYIFLVNLFHFIKASYKISKSKKAKFHGAEHMIANAYADLKKIPTLNETKKFSRFSKKCGSNKVIHRILFSLFVSLFIAFTSSISFFTIILFVSVSLFFAVSYMKGWLSFFQFLVTENPSDTELNLAITALRNFEEMEKEFNNYGLINVLFSISIENLK